MSDNIYEGYLAFKGEWRNYQKRILMHTQSYLTDKKVHIVAAPGSGKTTIGIELINRIGRPCLILAPSIAIRQQWIQRIQHSFLIDETQASKLISNQVNKPKQITIVTYQALYSCIHKLKDTLDDEDEEACEDVDFSGFDFFKTYKAINLGTICMDEAHHLRNEWWKSLDRMFKEFPEVYRVCLTATPPYDATGNEWKRYIDMCGVIDEKIYAPELVKEASLCPHQDYIYFNFPTKQEEQAVKEFEQHVANCLTEICNDEFTKLVASHVGLRNPEAYADTFLAQPQYFFAILIYLHEKGVPFSKYLRKLTGTNKALPKLSPEWMEHLLQGILFHDADAYATYNVYREQILHNLKVHGCMYRNKVCLVRNPKLDSLLISSKGKMDSIHEIVAFESKHMKTKLRQLILCDYIKKETLRYVGDDTYCMNELGVIPIFEQLRRKCDASVLLGVLSGSVVIIARKSIEAFDEIGKTQQITFTYKGIHDTQYVEVLQTGQQKDIVTMMTALFDCGGIHVLIGTKSLLGEGWDAPCINSLILASYVGSFVLSNQMRGRAIRSTLKDPHKTSNIWHLVCCQNGLQSQDFQNLKRRFRAFPGVSYMEDTIETGIERLDIPATIDTKSTIRSINDKMLQASKDRKGLEKRWKRALTFINDDYIMEDIGEVSKEHLKLKFVFVNFVALCIWLASVYACLYVFCNYGLFAILLAIKENSLSAFIISIICICSMVLLCKQAYRVLYLFSPVRMMKRNGEVLLKTLIETGHIEADKEAMRVCVSDGGIGVEVLLKGGTTRDKTLFISCIMELYAGIDNPRYIIKKKRYQKDYIAVPEILGKSKDDAQCFARNYKQIYRLSNLIYTRTPSGRTHLLRARTHSFVNRNDAILNEKKKIKSAYQ